MHTYEETIVVNILRELITTTPSENQPSTTPEEQLIERAPTGQSEDIPVALFGVEAGSKEHEDMVNELKYLKRYDPALYRKIMSLS